jgi:sugar/nucleoside kinase (ribokinase family)
MKKIITIGNAIVDVICKVEDSFLEQKGLIKNSMSLIENDLVKELSALKFEKITSGGSAGNTAAALAQLGVATTFVGKVGDDIFGQKFVEELQKTSTDFFSNKNHQKPTARSFVLLTPDAQRTMCTFLGCASEIEEFDIDEKVFANAKILYLEGYLWDKPSTILSLKKAISFAKKNGVKVAFSLSDSFCVARHKKDFLQLIENQIDILFANEAEASELSKNFSELFLKNKNLISVVTKGANGCEVFANEKSFKIPAKKVEKLTDTTGAGDIFAAGFLYGFINKFSLEKSAEFANLLASKIIQKFGARFENDELTNLF